MLNKNNYENLNLIVKNAKINLNLAYINLNYENKEIKLINNEKLTNIIDKIKIIENELDNYISFINHEKEELEEAEIKNNELMIDLLNNTEKVLANTQLDTTNSIKVEKTNVNLNTVSSTEFISKSVIKTDANVSGIKQVVTKVISTISSIFKKVTGAEVKSDVTSNQPTKTNNSSFLRNINGSLNQISNSLVSNIAKIIKVDESIVDVFAKGVNNYFKNYSNSGNFFKNKGYGTSNIKNKKQLEEIIKAANGSFRDLFKTIQNFNGTGYYGNNQSILTNLFLKNIENDSKFDFETIRLELLMVSKYNMSLKDSYKTIRFLDSIGACTYASTADLLCAKYAKNPDAFYDKYGYYLYYEDLNGNVRFNTEEMLIDMFIKANTDKKVAVKSHLDINDTIDESVFITDENGKRVLNEKAFLYSYDIERIGGVDVKRYKYPLRLGGQDYMEEQTFTDYTGITEITALTNKMNNTTANEDSNNILKMEIEDFVNRNELIRLGMLNYELEEIDTGNICKSNTEGHVAFVTGYENDGIILSTWGGEYKLNYSDIIENQTKYTLYLYQNW